MFTYFRGDFFHFTFMLSINNIACVLVIPETFNFGRLLVGQENIRHLPIKNIGQVTAVVGCECDHNSVIFPLVQSRIEPGAHEKVELQLKSKRPGQLKERLKFSNGAVCILEGVFVEEALEIFS